MSFSEIVHGLWVGSRPRQVRGLDSLFDLLVLAENQWQPPTGVFKPLPVIRAPMTDDFKGMPVKDKLQALRAARSVSAAVQEQKQVLVTCYMGLNRSALIAALVLTRAPFKMPASEAISHIRSMRSPYALSNPNFEKFLHDIAEAALATDAPP